MVNAAGTTEPEGRREAVCGIDDGLLSVVVPVYNEAGNVVPLAEEIAGALDGRIDYEIVFVDDGSDDATGEALAALGRRMPCLHMRRHGVNCGQSAALWTGIRAARGAWIATLDGDGQNDPADILTLLEVARADDAPDGLVMVSGVRVRRQDNWLRRLSSRLANRVRAALLHDDAPDSGCGLKLFRRDAYTALPTFDHMHRFLPALMQRDGGAVVHVAVNHRPRLSGTSKYGFGIGSRLWVGVVDLIGVMWLRRRALPAAVDDKTGTLRRGGPPEQRGVDDE